MLRRAVRVASGFAMWSSWALVAHLTADGLLAQATAHGRPIQVNSYTTGSQSTAAVDVAASGEFVVVWQSEGSSGSDTSDLSIQARRFTRWGAPGGPEFQVNTFTPSQQAWPAVAADPAGNFVVVWQSAGSPATDQSGTSIQARWFAANGTPLTAQFQVNTHTTGDQSVPGVARSSAAESVIVWTSQGNPLGDLAGGAILGRRFDPSGSPLGDEFRVNSYTTGIQAWPRVASADGGQFVVTWASYGSPGDDNDGYSVQRRRFAANGVPLETDVQVNEATISHEEFPAVSSTPGGDFVITWVADGAAFPDVFDTSVQARRFNVAGGGGSEFQVNTYSLGFQISPAVAHDAAGRVVLVWQSDWTDASVSIQARRLLANGAALGSPFSVDPVFQSPPQWNDFRPAAGADAAGNFVVVWQSQGTYGTDSSGLSVQVRLFDELFWDGFESGNFARWTVVP